MTDPKKIEAIARRFQRQMEQSGLAVSIRAGTGPSFDITVLCPHCQKAVGNLPAHVKTEHPEAAA